MAETNVLALFPYVLDLFGGMVDLLQLESVPATSVERQRPTEPSEPEPNDQGNGKGCGELKVEVIDEGAVQVENTRPTPQPLPPTMDGSPTAANSKFPPLRRAALHFLTILIRACISRVYDMGPPAGTLISDAHTARARMTLEYVAVTDEDAIVRVMAREAKEGLAQLSHALVGL